MPTLDVHKLIGLLPRGMQNKVDAYFEALEIFTQIRDPRVRRLPALPALLLVLGLLALLLLRRHLLALLAAQFAVRHRAQPDIGIQADLVAAVQTTGGPGQSQGGIQLTTITVAVPGPLSPSDPEFQAAAAAANV